MAQTLKMNVSISKISLFMFRFLIKVPFFNVWIGITKVKITKHNATHPVLFYDFLNA